ncbi:O-antigen ligase family protein [Streptomyces sp. NPDC002004]
MSGNAFDVTGVMLLGACAVWSLVSAAARDGRPEGVLLAVLAAAAGYACGRISGALLPVGAPGAAAIGGVALAALAPRMTPLPDTVAPLGHEGATAALLALSAGAACCAAWGARGTVSRLLLCLLAAGVAGAAGVMGSLSGLAACAGVLLLSLAAARMRPRALGLAGLALVAALATTAVWAVAADMLPPGPSASLEGPLTGHRVLLWRDAVDMARGNPVLGAGPGRFEELSPTVAQTLLTDGKPHSAPLQQAAEQGLVGLALLCAVFCWVFCALWRSPRPTPVVLTAGAALSALVAIASMGNALSFTTVTAGAGLLAGLATARPLGHEPAPQPEEARPRSHSGLGA